PTLFRSPQQPALYGEADVAQVLKRCKTLRYGKLAELGDGVQLRLLDAGHILGSSIVELSLDIQGLQRTLVFSGDLGNADTALMHKPATLKQADVVVMEGTYGDRNHRSLKATLKEFEDVIVQAGMTGGNLLI